MSNAAKRPRCRHRDLAWIAVEPVAGAKRTWALGCAHCRRIIGETIRYSYKLYPELIEEFYVGSDIDDRSSVAAPNLSA